MEKFHAMYEESTKLNEFNENEYKTIFDIFDDEGSGSLDFREFLICFSVLLRGSLE
jgi:Ca2+-binding EF-hand superfamily protein